MPPVIMFLCASRPSELGFDVASADVFQPPNFLPVRSKDDVPTWSCSDEGGVHFSRRLDHCTDEGLCMSGFLVALRGKRPLHVCVRRATESWSRVGLEGGTRAGATLIPPLTGWYRIRVTAESQVTVQVCDHQDGRPVTLVPLACPELAR